MTPPKPSNRPRVGEPWDLRSPVPVMVGPYCLYPGSNAENGKEGWEIVVDDELHCVWLGRYGWWTRLGWDSCNYVRYRKPDSVP